ncbi:MAG: non-ribosomal peptide synthetase, partial [bacterium]|nr:non-ribosomal peptide synthetase [bacterium]
KNAFIDSYRKIDRERAFDLNKDVLMRVSIIRLDEAEYDVTWNFHHIVMDGWCTEMVHADFFEIYKSIKENRSPDLAPAVPYRTYIEWLETRDKEESGRFWKAYLEGYEEMSTLCGQEPPATQKAEFQNEKLDFILDAETTTLLTQLATRNNDTLNTVIQSAWAVILGKYCRKHDVVFGAVVSGRPPGLEGVETMVGLFINTLPVRIRFEEDTPFADLLHSVRENAMESEPHHYYSLAEIQAESPLNGNLFDHGLVFENYPVSEKIDDIAPGNDNGGKLQFSGFEFLQQAVYDFVIVVVPGERLSMTIQYNENVYEKSFINRVAVHIKEVFAGVVRDEKMQIADIKISHDLLMARANPTQRKKSDFRF